MSPANQGVSDHTTAVVPHNASATAITNSPDVARSIVPPEEATVTFTQQDAPLLRLPGELRNRIYHEWLQLVFDELEKNKKSFQRYDPKILRPTLAALTACRQIHQEAMPVLFRAQIAEKPFWCVRDSASITHFFTRVKAFCQTMKRHAPHAHFRVSLTCHELQSSLFSQDQARDFVGELVHQCQRPADLSFELASMITPADLELCPAWMSGRFLCDGKCAAAKVGAHWNAKRSDFFARGSVGAFRFTYTWCGSGGTRHRMSYLMLEGSLAQLDWDALEDV